MDENQTVVCHQQRTALMKSLLNFLKRAIADTNYAAQVRRSKFLKSMLFITFLNYFIVMEAELPRSIIYIIENPDYFGCSLLHCGRKNVIYLCFIIYF